MKPDHIARRESATDNYLRSRKHRRLILCAAFAVFVGSVIAAHAGLLGQNGDDWSQFNHKTFQIASIPSGDSVVISTRGDGQQTIQLLGVVGTSQSREWLKERAQGQRGTFLLQIPQTRDAKHHLLAYLFVDNQNLNVEVVRTGFAYADRRSKCEMDGLIDPAEGEARKKQRGIWANLKFEQMPQWRQEWLKILPRRKAIGH